MLGSNPSADSVASTDPGGCCAIPLSSVCRHRARIGRGTKAQNPGGAGAKPLRHSLLPLRKPASSHNACLGDWALVDKLSGIAGRKPVTGTDRGLLRPVLGPWSPVPKCEA